MRIFSISLAIGFSIAGLALAAEPCDPNACTEVQVYGSADRCGHCGCNSRCEKYCRVVCEIKEVKKYVWVVECEEFCPPLPNRRGGGRCDGCRGNGSCNPDCGCCDGKRDPCAVEKNKSFIPPKCGKMRVKKKLVKKEIVCKVPSYKCVVVYCCPKCECNECDETTPPPASKQTALPPAPAPNKTTQDAPLPPVMGAM